MGPGATVPGDLVNKSKLDLTKANVTLSMFTNNQNKDKLMSRPGKMSRPPLKEKDESEIKKPKEKYLNLD